MSITFSIVIPAHNEEAFIAKVLHSIKQQTYQNYEIIIVTNGCTDKTEEIVKKRVNDKILHLNLNTANVSRARNYGAGKAQGKYLLFLDADTLLEPNTLKVMKESFKEHHAVAVTRVKADIPGWQYALTMKSKNFCFRTGLYKGCSGVILCKRTDFDEINGYDPERIVREHRKLILSLANKGKYIVAPTYVTTSMRRMEKWGLAKAGFFWTKQLLKDKFSNLKNSEYEKIR